MNKIFYRAPFLIALLIGAGILVYYSPSFRTYISLFSSQVESFYHSIALSISDRIDNHTFQAKKIKDLKDELGFCKNRLYIYRSDAERYQLLKKELALQGNIISNQIVQPLGYVQLGNFQKLWLERFKDYDPQYIYGVLKEGNAVGIIVEKKNRPLMILAGDPECNFAVYIGDEKAPGIAFGLDARTMVVRYIPEWMKINIGD